MDTVPTDHSDIGTWTLSTRPLRPYRMPNPDFPQDSHYWVYLSGPITPHLFRLQPGNVASLEAFIGHLGLTGLLTWVYNYDAPEWAHPLHEEWVESRNPEFRDRPPLRTREPWRSVMQLISPWLPAAGIPRSQIVLPAGPPEPKLYAAVIDAWTDPATVTAFGAEQWLLERNWGHTADLWQFTAEVHHTTPRAPELLDYVLFEQPLDDFATEPVADRGQLVDVPVTVFVRSYLELVDLIGRGLGPVRCEHCRQWFPPRRAGTRFCPGTSCRSEAYAPYEKDPYRRQYQRMYKRYKRGTITQSEWDQWRDEHPGPGSMKGDGDGKH